MKKWSVVNKFRFNQDGTYPFYSHLISNYLGERRTWAIYWYATIFDAKGLCLTPGVTLTNEMGSDGSGTHGLNNEMYVANLSMSENWNFQGLDATEDQVARVAVASFNRQYYGILSRMINTLRLVIPLWWRHMQRKGG
jgi:hypothetical protein